MKKLALILLLVTTGCVSTSIPECDVYGWTVDRGFRCLEE
jgi:hypothetical protein